MFEGVALANSFVGTSPVTIAWDAGQPMARKMPVPSINAYVQAIGPSVIDIQASPSPLSANPTWAIWMSRFLG